jgi:hypothetical protein
MKLKRKNTARRLRNRTGGTGCIWPSGVETHFGISTVTRWRWEKLKKLPARDVFVNGVAVGWKPQTLQRAERGEVMPA